jgi:hypothetical protein
VIEAQKHEREMPQVGIFATRSIATLDRRHFEILQPLAGGRFLLVP